jgi:hypothetical protein
MWLVSVVAYSGATYRRLTLCSGCSVTFLLSLLVVNYNLLTIRFCRKKVVNSTRLYLEGPNQLLGNLYNPPPKYIV